MSSQFFYGEPGGEVRGPLDLGVLDVAVKSGRLSSAVMLSETGREPWAPLQLVLRSGPGSFHMVALEAKRQAEQEKIRAADLIADESPAALPPVMKPMSEMTLNPPQTGKRYKVVTQKDKWFSGKFDPVLLEGLLNDLARDGWRVVSMVSASREGVLTGGGKDELIVLLENDS
jgi:Domain of unknown function (DUF4177)